LRYTIFCDESRHTGGPDARYQVIGGLWVPSEKKDAITKELKSIRRDVGLNGEIKWSKVSSKMLNSYLEIVKFYFNCQDINYRAIIVDQHTVDHKIYHNGDKELGFYKFYYEMLEKWLRRKSEYTVLLDFKKNKGADRYTELRRCLESYGQSRDISIKDLTVIDSKHSHLAQLCDLLTGAVSTDANDAAVGVAKLGLISEMAALRGTPRLSVASISPAFSKFNVFRINLVRSAS
jgi:hypothetical protein